MDIQERETLAAYLNEIEIDLEDVERNRPPIRNNPLKLAVAMDKLQLLHDRFFKYCRGWDNDIVKRIEQLSEYAAKLYQSRQVSALKQRRYAKVVR